MRFLPMTKLGYLKPLIKVNTNFNLVQLKNLSTKKIEQELKDIVIVGGGTVGLALACSIANDIQLNGGTHVPLKVTLLERYQLPSLPTNSNYSNRVVSLTPKSVNYLKQIGAYQHLNKERLTNYSNIEIYDINSSGKLQLKSEQLNYMAMIVELNQLNYALMKRLNELKDNNSQSLELELIDEIDLKLIESNDLLDWPIIELKDKTFRSRLIIGADGPNSPVRKFGNIESFGYDYNQMGMVGTLTIDSLKPNTAYQRFLPTGPIAILPLNSNQSSMVWSMSNVMSNQLKKLEPELITSLVNIALTCDIDDYNYIIKRLEQGALDKLDLDLGWRPIRMDLPLNLPKIISVDNLANFPLKLRHTNRYIDHRIALVGDAAHSIHPLAGMGLNLGLGDAHELSSILNSALHSGSDLGTITTLQSYAQNRYFTNLQMLGITDKLHRAFTITNPIFSSLRGFGMNFLNSSFANGLRQFVVGKASEN